MPENMTRNLINRAKADQEHKNWERDVRILQNKIVLESRDRMAGVKGGQEPRGTRADAKMNIRKWIWSRRGTPTKG